MTGVSSGAPIASPERQAAGADSPKPRPKKRAQAPEL